MDKEQIQTIAMIMDMLVEIKAGQIALTKILIENLSGEDQNELSRNYALLLTEQQKAYRDALDKIFERYTELSDTLKNLLNPPTA